MCTAINSVGKYHLFGRTLDLECSYGEKVVVSPRNFRIDLLHQRSFISHLAIVGMACVRNGMPLYYDAMNEAGLAMAGLNFPDNAVYCSAKSDRDNVASFELILWVLCQCESVSAAEKLLQNINITADSFSEDMPASPLHWIVADKNRAITVEATEDGLKIYENSLGVLTNNPPFPYHMMHIADFLQLNSAPPENRLCKRNDIKVYSRGLGASGLPGDPSSASRFIRAVFFKEHTDSCNTEEGEVGRFFHIADSLSVPCGSVKTYGGESVMTVYTSCACSNSLTYYFTTYGCRRIRAVGLGDMELDSGELMSFDIDSREDVLTLNTDRRR